MKNKIIFFVFMCFYANTSFSQTILVQNKEHVIYYTFSGENVVFTVEDGGVRTGKVLGRR